MRSGQLYAAIKQREKTNKQVQAFKTTFDSINKGIDPNKLKDITTGNTPLFAAIKLGYPEIAAALIHSGANPQQTNKEGQTAYSMAEKQGADVKSYLEKEAKEYETTKTKHTQQVIALFKAAEEEQIKLLSAANINDRKGELADTPKLINDIVQHKHAFIKIAEELDTAIQEAYDVLPRFVVTQLLNENKIFSPDVLTRPDESLATLYREQTTKEHDDLQKFVTETTVAEQQKSLALQKRNELISKKTEEAAIFVTEAKQLCESYHLLQRQITTHPNFLELREPQAALKLKTEAWIKNYEAFKKHVDLDIKNDVKIDDVISKLEAERAELSDDIFISQIIFAEACRGKALDVLKDKHSENYRLIKNSLTRKIKALTEATNKLSKEVKEGSGASAEKLLALTKSLQEFKGNFSFALELGTQVLVDEDIQIGRDCLRTADAMILLANAKFCQQAEWLVRPINQPSTRFSGNSISTDSTDFLLDAFNGNEKALRKKIGGFSRAKKLFLSAEKQKEIIDAKDLSKKDSDGRTAFMLAIANNRCETANYLMHRSDKTKNPAHQLELNKRDNNGQTALTLAARRSQLEAIHYCLKLNTPTKRQAWLKDSIEALKSDCKTDLSKLYEKHKMINLTPHDNEEMTAFMRSIICHNNDEKLNEKIIAAFLNEIKQHNACVNEMNQMAQRPETPTKQSEELKHGADNHSINIFKCDIYGRTAFHSACAFGTRSAIIMLLEHLRQNFGYDGVRAMLTSPDKNGYTPLMLAAGLGRKEIVAELLTHYQGLRVDLNQTDPYLKFTALDFSIHHRKLLNKAMKKIMREDKQANVSNEQVLLKKHTDLELALRTAGVRSSIEQANENDEYLSFLDQKAEPTPVMTMAAPAAVVAASNVPPPVYTPSKPIVSLEAAVVLEKKTEDNSSAVALPPPLPSSAPPLPDSPPEKLTQQLLSAAVTIPGTTLFSKAPAAVSQISIAVTTATPGVKV